MSQFNINNKFIKQLITLENADIDIFYWSYIQIYSQSLILRNERFQRKNILLFLCNIKQWNRDGLILKNFYFSVLEWTQYNICWWKHAISGVQRKETAYACIWNSRKCIFIHFVINYICYWSNLSISFEMHGNTYFCY